MKLVLAEPRLLKESVAIISELVNEVTFKVDKNQIELIAMDPANVTMVLFKLLSSAFAEYTIDKSVDVTVNLESLNQVLKRAKPTDTVYLERDDNNNKLKVQLRGQSTRTFNIALMEAEETEQKVPKLEFSVTIDMESIVFNEAIEDMDIIAESVALTAEDKKLTVESEGRMNSAKVEIPGSEETKIKVKGSKAVVSKYSIEYLKKIIKGSKLADRMTIQFNEEYPLGVEYKVMDKLMLNFILAPRVSE